MFRAIPLGALDDLEPAFAAARKAALDRHAHPAIRRVSEANRLSAETLARDLVGALSALRAISSTASLRDCLASHRDALDSAVRGPGEIAEDAEGLETLGELMAQWEAAAADSFPCALDEYATLFDSAVAAVRAPPAGGGHPRLQILGLLEARLLSFDRVLLAGLDEAVWPPAVETDAFLNRPMRATLGLSAPERRIGQTAHDFVAALGAREAVLSRSRKRGGEPTVASRFLQRIVAAAGPMNAAITEAERRGARYLDFARALDQPAQISSIGRPEPRPPVERRPRALSVTRVETLRRDPYAIYAELILNLKVLEPVAREIGPRETGEAWHAALQEFAEKYPSGALPPDAREALFLIASGRFAPLLGDPGFRGLNWPNIEKSLDFVLDFERAARADVDRIWVERQGQVPLCLENGQRFRLSARADRIDVLRSGGAIVIDYKSGTPPGAEEVKVGFAPQLTLEAAILKRGGFEGLPALEPRQAIYLKVGGRDGGAEKPAGGKDADIAALAEKHFGELKTLLDQFASETTPYLSRPFPKFASRYAKYDHLARVKEWSATGGAGELEDAS